MQVYIAEIDNPGFWDEKNGVWTTNPHNATIYESKFHVPENLPLPGLGYDLKLTPVFTTSCHIPGQSYCNRKGVAYAQVVECEA